MFYKEGIADGYKDLASQIKNFLTTGLGASNWRVLRENDLSTEFDAPGLSGNEHIYLSMDFKEDPAKDHYYMIVRGSVSFIEGNPANQQPNVVHSIIPLINQSMPFWIKANGQRAIIVIRVSTSYMLSYLGKFLPYATPNQYPYPVIVSGMTTEINLRFSSNNLRSIVSPIVDYSSNIINSGYLFTPSHRTLQIRNNSNDYVAPNTAITTPDLPINDDNILLLPIIMLNRREREVYGELEGLYYISGFNVKTEDEIINDGKKFKIFQHLNLTGFNDYYALEIGDV